MKRVVSSSIISVVILLLIAGGFFYYQYYRVNASSALETVPSDAAWLIGCDPSSGELRQLAQTGFFQGHDSIPVMKDWYRYLISFDSLIANTSALKQQFSKHPLFLSGHVTGPGAFGLVFISEMDGANGDSKASALLETVFGKNAAQGTIRSYNGVDIHEIQPLSGSSGFSWAVSHGVFVGSNTAYLVEDAIRQQRNTKSPSPATRLQVFIDGKEKGMVLAIHYSSFQRWVSTQLNSASGVSFSPLQRIGDWSAARVTIHPTIISFVGTTTLNDSLEFLNLFKGQQAVQTNLLKLLPARTAAAVAWGFSDAKSFTNDLSAYLTKTDQSTASSASDRASLLPYFQPWMGNEIGLIVTQPLGSGTDNHFFGVIGIKDEVQCKSKLLECTRSLSKSNRVSEEEEVYNGYAIRYIPLPGLMPSLFGPLFTKVSRFYYAIVNNYVIVSNQASSLRGIINDIKTENLLVKDARYPALASAIPTTSNLLFYGSIPQSAALFSTVAAPQWVSWLSQYGSCLKSWNGLVYTVANRQGVFATTACLSYFQSGESGVTLAWNSKLDDVCVAGPFVVGQKNKQIIVQDAQNQIYSIDPDGSIRWKKKLESKIKGSVFSADLYHNGDEQILFNTTSFIYLLDTGGTAVGNYPLRLPAAASSGLTVAAGRTANEDSRMYVCCSNLRLYGYTINGKPLPGLSSVSLPGVVSDPLYLLPDSVSGWMMLRDNQGTSYFIDRSGNRKLTVREKVNLMQGTTLHISSDSTASFTWLSPEGIIYSSNESGNVKELYKGESDSLTGYQMMDLNGDHEIDWIHTSTEGVQAKTSDGVVLFRMKTTSAVADPVLVSWKGKKLILFTSSIDHKIYVLNSDGSVYDGFPQSGIGRAEKIELPDGSLGLIILGDEQSVSLYQVN